jgi:threonine dehydratase
MTVSIETIDNAAVRLRTIVEPTPLQFSRRLSEKHGARVYLKREDLHEVRSFKIRGAYNKMASRTTDERARGVVCASAGNHAQGVAYCCRLLETHGAIFMPVATPNQKIERVRQFGGPWISIEMGGDSFDDANRAALEYCQQKNALYVHPFDDELVISGQGTVGKEIHEQLAGAADIVISSIGGGGLIAGIATYCKQMNERVVVIGAEPQGAAGMHESLQQGSVSTLAEMDTFVDGAAVRTVGSLPFSICRDYIDAIVAIPEGHICTTMIELYQQDGIVAEPAGALGVAALDFVSEPLGDRTVVCILSGGNNDILRYPDILERSLVYQGRKHYFIVEFAQKPGQLRRFVDDVLGPTDDIVRFEYMKKTNKERGAALVGIELQDRTDLDALQARLERSGMRFHRITPDDVLYDHVI